MQLANIDNMATKLNSAGIVAVIVNPYLIRIEDDSYLVWTVSGLIFLKDSKKNETFLGTRTETVNVVWRSFSKEMKV